MKLHADIENSADDFKVQRLCRSDTDMRAFLLIDDDGLMKILPLARDEFDPSARLSIPLPYGVDPDLVLGEAEDEETTLNRSLLAFHKNREDISIESEIAYLLSECEDLSSRTTFVTPSDFFADEDMPSMSELDIIEVVTEIETKLMKFGYNGYRRALIDRAAFAEFLRSN